MKKILTAVLIVAMLFAFAACKSDIEEESGDVIVNSMGVDFKYEKTPERVVALGYDNVEILIKLGLEDKIVAIAPSMYSKDNLKKEDYEKIKDKKILPDGNFQGVPNLETILAELPDFVFGTSYSFSPKSCGAVSDFMSQNINIYATEGTSVDNADIETVYHDFENIGKIFGVEEKAGEIVDDMKTKIGIFEEKLKGVEPVKTMILDSIVNDKPIVFGSTPFGSRMLERAGGENIFADLKESYPVVSIEEIIAKNPEIIVIEDYPESPAESKIQLLGQIKELKDVEAVKNRNYVIIPMFQLFPTAQNLEGIESMAKKFHPSLFD